MTRVLIQIDSERSVFLQMSKDTLDRKKIDDRIHKQAGNVPSRVLQVFASICI